MPFRRKQQPEQHFYGRRFPRSVRPEQTEHLAPLHLEINIVDSARFRPVPKILEDFGQPANHNHVLA
jgi:hypothetical protein